jgi:hypothetical protein
MATNFFDQLDAKTQSDVAPNEDAPIGPSGELLNLPPNTGAENVYGGLEAPVTNKAKPNFFDELDVKATKEAKSNNFFDQLDENAQKQFESPVAQFGKLATDFGGLFAKSAAAETSAGLIRQAGGIAPMLTPPLPKTTQEAAPILPEDTSEIQNQIADKQAAIDQIKGIVKKQGFSTPEYDNSITNLQQEIQGLQSQAGQVSPESIQGTQQLRQERVKRMGEYEKTAESMYPAMGVSPTDASIAAQLGRGVGDIASMAPSMLLGLPGMAVAGAGQAYSEAYKAKEDELKQQGVTDQQKIDDEAHTAGSIAAVETLPQLGTYMVGGKLVSKATSALMKEASPLAKAFAGGTAAAGVNILTSAGLRAASGQPMAPTIQGSVQDILFGGFHGVGAGLEARAEQRKAEATDAFNVARMAREAAERNLAPSSNPQVNEKQAQITAQADQQRPQVDSESVNAQFKILTDQLKDVNEQLQGLPEDHPDIEGLQNKAGTIAQQMAALERGEPIELEIPKKEEPEGDERFKPKPTPEEAPPPKEEPSASEQAPVVEPTAETPVTIYHGTTEDAAKAIEQNGFDVSKSSDGTFWFTTNKDKIESGEVAASGKGSIIQRAADEGALKLGGWDEHDKYSNDQLISMGYDGLKLPDKDETTYQIFHPEKLKKIASEEKPAEAPAEAQPTQPNAVQIENAGEVGVRNAPAVGEGVGEENKPEVAPEQGEAPKEEVKPAEVEPKRNLERQANEARDRIDARRREGRQTMWVDPDSLPDYAIIAANHIAKGVKTFTEFSKNMLEEFGNAIRPYLNKIWEAGKKAYNAYSTGGGRFTKVGAEAGAIRLPRTLQKKVEKAKETAVFAYKSRPAKEAITVSKDAGENAAGIIAKHAANEINNQINRDFFGKKDRKSARLALPFVVEAKADINELNRMEQTLKTSKKADPHWQKVALDAIDFARNNLAKLTPTADRVSKMFIRQAGEENANGIYTPIMEAYFAHYQDLDNSMMFGKPGTSGGTGFRKMRVHDTFADSIAAGIDPKSLDAIDILQKRIDSGQKAIAYRTWIDALKNTTDPNSGKQIVTKIPMATRPDGTQYPQPPDGYHTEHLAGQNVAVKDGYEGILSALDDPSAWSKNMAGRVAMKAAGAGKGLALMIDTFHLGRVAINQSVIRSLGLSTFKAPIPSYKKGVTLLDHSIPELQRMIANGEIPQKWAAGILESKRLLDVAVKTGFNVGRITDSLHQDWIHNIPGIGDFNKWLFGQFQRGAMAETWLLEFQRYRNAYKGMPEEQVARMVSKDLNTKFGSLGRQGILKSRTAQDTAKMLFLAPQWNEGLIRSELGAVKQTGQAIYDAATGKRLFAGVLARYTGGMIAAQFLANQIINYATRGTPTWDNPEEGIGAKMSAYVPDFISGGPGFFLNPMSLAMETTHLLMKGFERTGDYGKTLAEYLRSRSSTVSRPIWDFVTNKTFLGKEIKPNQMLTQMMSDAVPAPIIGSALYAAGKQAVTGEPSEQFAGQYQKQLMSSFGIKTESAPSDESRIYTLANHYRMENNIEDNRPKTESPYHDVNRALAIGNMTDAKTAMEKLLETKTPAQLEKYYNQSYSKLSMFQNKSQQKDFMDSLNDEQKEAYQRAIEKRKDISIKARDLIQDLK